MYSHDNLTFTTRVVVETYGWHKESVVSYLPMSHIAALDFDMLCLIQCGGTMYCADKNALKGTLVSPSLFQPCPAVLTAEFGSLIEVGLFRLQKFRQTCHISAPNVPICQKF